ncbi:hypothetical protein OAA37_00715 [bacterium]|jgi:hypothetical protein|nr:hypothetical protein [bacterium]MDB4347976.1 hypothetical protein [bacterium]
MKKEQNMQSVSSHVKMIRNMSPERRIESIERNLRILPDWIQQEVKSDRVGADKRLKHFAKLLEQMFKLHAEYC